jgi:hypothetical protein
MLTLDPDTDLALWDRELRLRRPELPAPLTAPWSDDPVVTREGDRAWLVVPAEADPSARDGRVVIPRDQLRRLKHLAATDLPVQRIAIAHELDVGGAVAAMLPSLADGPVTCSVEEARRLAGPLPVHPLLAEAARLLDIAVGGSLRAGAAAIDLLDPIVFGVVAPTRPEPGTSCLWYPLVAWRW